MAFPNLLALLIFLVISLLAILLLTRERRGRPKLPPGPTNLPIIGSLHRLGVHPHRSLLGLSRVHGPLVYLRLGSVPLVVASSAGTAKEFLRTHDLSCCSRPLLTAAHRFSYGSSDLGCSPRWRDLRRVWASELFSPKKLLSSRAVREEEVERTVRWISSQHHAVNLGEVLPALVNNIICRSALGKSYQSTGKGSRLKRSFTEMNRILMEFFFADYLPMFGWMDRLTGLRARLDRIFFELDRFYQEVIDEHRDSARCAKDRPEDAIDTLLNMMKEGAHDITNENVKGMLMNIFVAGSGTSYATIEWAMAELMRNPMVMNKAKEEARSLVGNKGKVDEADLGRLEYLNCVVKETMRLHPTVPLLLPRETIRHFKVGGYDVPPKTRLLVNAFAIGRDKNVWERPEEFCPERFVSSPIDFRGHDFELVPFGAGRRMCPGMDFGILVVKLALANLLYSFDWELPAGTTEKDVDMSEAPGIAMHRKSALRLRAKKYNVMEG